jgi:hypothetical protein
MSVIIRISFTDFLTPSSFSTLFSRLRLLPPYPSRLSLLPPYPFRLPLLPSYPPFSVTFSLSDTFLADSSPTTSFFLPLSIACHPRLQLPLPPLHSYPHHPLILI